MSPCDLRLANLLLEFILEHISIPKSYYEKAAARHKSLGEWLCRPESLVAIYRPEVIVQGSFRYGTVNRPLLDDEVYDLDDVTVLHMSKTKMTQKELKHLYGKEVKAYAKAHGFLSPVEEKDRCWRLVYADDVSFHLDTLPCVPEEPAVIQGLIDKGAIRHLAQLAVAITDRRHEQYDQITQMLTNSNPRGFAVWFEERCRVTALTRIRQLVESRVYASVDDVPPYEWKTVLQLSIQVLKRHRDVMFQHEPELAPISMIITNLAAHAYAGEEDLCSALLGIVERMPLYIRSQRPWIPNPAAPSEDYADKWSKSPKLRDSFDAWHIQVKTDLAKLPFILAGQRLDSEVSKLFAVDLTQSEIRALAPSWVMPLIRAAPVLPVSNPARPWGNHA